MLGPGLVNHQGQIQHANHQFCRLLGYDQTQMEELSIEQLLPVEFMAQEGTIRSEWAREVCLIQVLKRDSSVIGVEIGVVPLKVGGSLLTQSQIDWALLHLISFGFLLACYLRRWDGRLVPVWLSASRRGLLIKWCCYQPKMYLSNVGREKNCNKRGKKPSRPTGPVCLLHEPRNSPSCTVYCFS